MLGAILGNLVLAQPKVAELREVLALDEPLKPCVADPVDADVQHLELCEDRGVGDQLGAIGGDVVARQVQLG